MLVLADIDKYRVMSVNKVMLLVALFIVVLDNSSLWSGLWVALGENPVSHIVFMISFFAFLVVLTLLLLSLFSFVRVIKIAAIIVLLSSSLISYFIDNLHVIFSVSMIQNLFETDVNEATELINASILIHFFMFGVLPSIFIWFIKIEAASVKSEIVSRVKLLSVLLFITALSMLWSSKDYAFVLRENRSLRYLVNPVFPLTSLVKYLKIQTGSGNKNRALVPVFSDAEKIVNTGSETKKDILIIVVGETARAANFSLNGYARETNPNLKQENIINYNDTTSCGTATAQSVPCMFSDLTHDNFSVSKAKSRENLLDGLSNAGLDVLWRDNNSSCKGVCARVETEDLRELQVKDLCNDEECYDEILLHKLDDYMNTITHDAVIILHQKGSHGPAYYKRYPKEFAKFKPECNLLSVHNCNHNEIVNAYDNTILYSDYFLSKVIDFLKVRSDKYNTAVVYMSDHGESLGENGVYLHGLPYFMAPEDQTHVPFIVWLSENMKQQKYIDSECLIKNSSKKYSQDNFVHSVLGLMDISTKSYDKNKDVFAVCRTFNMVKKSQQVFIKNS